MQITVLHEAWRPHPLAWIHRAEARELAAELQRAGHTVSLVRYSEALLSRPPGEALLLRLSDPLMLLATRAFEHAATPFLGPGAAVMERCYDKYVAGAIAAGNGIECPATALAGNADAVPFPLVLKPRRGSDSIGVRVLHEGPIPAHVRNDAHIVQEHVRGMELTIGVIRGRAGLPLRIFLPEGTPYSFLRKYLKRPRRAPLADRVLAERARSVALRIAGTLETDWAARVDLMLETATGRLCFLECDVAPLIGPRSAFAASLAAAGVTRAEQWPLLLEKFPKQSGP